VFQVKSYQSLSYLEIISASTDKATKTGGETAGKIFSLASHRQDVALAIPATLRHCRIIFRVSHGFIMEKANKYSGITSIFLVLGINLLLVVCFVHLG
jgi:hypothetical protein